MTEKQSGEEQMEVSIPPFNCCSSQFIQLQEEERKRIARELHDSIGQSLSLIKNKLYLLKQIYKDTSKLHEDLDNITEIVSKTIHEVRTISYSLRPYHLDLIGLTQSIKSLIEEYDSSNIDFDTQLDLIDNIFSKEEEINVFRMVQECLNNILKHSKADSVRIKIKKEDLILKILVEDNGIGINNQIKQAGFGLVGMQERINIMQGRIEITKNEPSGTKVIINLPIAKSCSSICECTTDNIG